MATTTLFFNDLHTSIITYSVTLILEKFFVYLYNVFYYVYKCILSPCLSSICILYCADFQNTWCECLEHIVQSSCTFCADFR